MLDGYVSADFVTGFEMCEMILIDIHSFNFVIISIFICNNEFPYQDCL